MLLVGARKLRTATRNVKRGSVAAVSNFSLCLRVAPCAAALICTLFAQAAHAQSHGETHAWGISGEARVASPSPAPTSSEPAVARTHVEFGTDGRPQIVAVYLGEVTRGTQRISSTENIYRDLCTTPCAREFVPGSYDLYTRGPGTVSGLHRYRIGARNMRFHLRTRPAWTGALAGASLAVGVLATLGSVALLANGAINHGDLAPGWIVLGIGGAFGVFGTVLEFYAQGTGPSRVEQLP